MAITFDTPEMRVGKFPSIFNVSTRKDARKWYGGCLADDNFKSVWSWQEMFDLFTAE